MERYIDRRTMQLISTGGWENDSDIAAAASGGCGYCGGRRRSLRFCGGAGGGAAGFEGAGARAVNHVRRPRHGRSCADVRADLERGTHGVRRNLRGDQPRNVPPHERRAVAGILAGDQSGDPETAAR